MSELISRNDYEAVQVESLRSGDVVQIRGKWHLVLNVPSASPAPTHAVVLNEGIGENIPRQSIVRLPQNMTLLRLTAPGELGLLGARQFVSWGEVEDRTPSVGVMGSSLALIATHQDSFGELTRQFVSFDGVIQEDFDPRRGFFLTGHKFVWKTGPDTHIPL